MDQQNLPQGTHRREFLKNLALIGLVTGIAPFSWSCKGNTSQLSYTGSGEGPYRVWEEMLMALETSADHLEGQYKALIAGKDPKAMFDFVRDQIHLMPVSRTELYGMQTAMRYGTKAVLRYGFATPREKAELLNEMFTQAGIPSKVVYESIEFKNDEVESFFFRKINRPFSPEVDKKTRKRWAAELGDLAGKKKFELVQPDPTIAKKLADELWKTFPDLEDNKSAVKTSFEWDRYSNGTPTVAFEWEGKTQYAHLFDATVAFGELKTKDENKVKPAADPKIDHEKIRISVSIRTGLDPKQEKEIISGEWLLRETVGNRIGLSFQNGLTLEEQTITPIGDLRVFTPALSFESFDQPLSFMEERSFVGTPFTLDGRIIDTTGETVKIDGYGLLEKPSKDLQNRIASMKVTAIPMEYPLVKLKVVAEDSNGELVEGLSAVDFSIADNKSPVKAILESNQRTPNVLILYDVSGSMPSEYRNKGMDSFMEQLEKSILQKYPAARLNKWPTDSSLFGWLRKASQTSNDLIIFATDGDNDDRLDPEMEPIYRSGPPAIVLSVKGTTSESFDKMAELTNGIVLMAEERQQTANAIASFLEKMEIPPYVFTYYASDADVPHKVDISIDDNRLKAEANYEFSPVLRSNQPIGERIAGMYLTIRLGSRGTLKRVLAGWSEYDNNGPTKKDFSDVRSMVLGGALISVEGEGPTLAAALSDELKYKLSTRNWGEPLMRGDDKKAIEEFEKGGMNYNSLLVPLMAPIQNGVTENSYTYAAGPRVAIIKNKVGLGDTTGSVSFDYLPLSDYLSLDRDGTKAFRTTLEKTAQLAILENAYFPNTTMESLKDKTLIDLKTAGDDNWFRNNPQVEKDPGFWHGTLRLNNYGSKTTQYPPLTAFDKSGQTKAYWQISHDTGELYGILHDGTGGGAKSIEKQLRDIDNVVEAYAKLINHMSKGLSSTALPIVAIYSKTLVKLYAIASVAIVIMENSQMNKEIRDALISLANEVAEHIADL